MKQTVRCFRYSGWKKTAAHRGSTIPSTSSVVLLSALILFPAVLASGGCPASTGSTKARGAESPRPDSIDSQSDEDTVIPEPGETADTMDKTDPTPEVEEVPKLVDLFSIRVPSEFGRVLSLGAHGRRIGVGTETNQVHILDAKTKKAVWSSGNLEQSPMCISFSADGSNIMAGGSGRSNYIWRVTASGRGKHYRTWHRKQGDMHALSGDGSTLVREDIRKSIRWYELATYKMKWLTQGRGLAVSGDGRRVAMFNRKGLLEIRDSITGKQEHSVKDIPAKARYALNHDGAAVFYVEESKDEWSLAGVNATTGEGVLETGPQKGKIQGFMISPTKPYGIVWGDFGLSVIELAQGKVIITRPDRVRLAAIYDDKVCTVARKSSDKIECGRIHVP